MPLPRAAHTSRPWRIHELTPGFRLEDVWGLPTPGGPHDFPALVRLMATREDPARGRGPWPARALVAARRTAGQVLGWDSQDAFAGARPPTLRDRLPADLRDAPPGPDLTVFRFAPLYLADNECAAEIASRTVHGVLHLGWVSDEAGGYRGQMAVLVKPNGWLGICYLAAIRPLRYLIVYPLWLRDIGRAWSRRPAGPRVPQTADR
jgi:hypothetical protein